jgi:hypothetical protein
MAVHKRIRKAGGKLLAHVRGAGRTLQRRREGGRLARDQARDRLDERLAAIAAEVLAGKYYECAWELMRFGHFPGMSHEEAAGALGRRPARGPTLTAPVGGRKLTERHSKPLT